MKLTDEDIAGLRTQTNWGLLEGFDVYLTPREFRALLDRLSSQDMGACVCLSPRTLGDILDLVRRAPEGELPECPCKCRRCEVTRAR